MRIVSRRALREFWATHPDAEQPLRTWFTIVRNAEWRNAADVQRALSGVSILRNQRACFNIKGNDYRLVVRFDYRFRIAFIRFVGTHADYDKVDANTI